MQQEDEDEDEEEAVAVAIEGARAGKVIDEEQALGWQLISVGANPVHMKPDAGLARCLVENHVSFFRPRLREGRCFIDKRVARYHCI